SDRREKLKMFFGNPGMCNLNWRILTSTARQAHTDLAQRRYNLKGYQPRRKNRSPTSKDCCVTAASKRRGQNNSRTHLRQDANNYFLSIVLIKLLSINSLKEIFPFRLPLAISCSTVALMPASRIRPSSGKESRYSSYPAAASAASSPTYFLSALMPSWRFSRGWFTPRG